MRNKEIKCCHEADFDRVNGKTEATQLPESYLLNALGYYQGTNYLYKHMLDRNTWFFQMPMI
ncbi:MAG: hypothetical protein H6Q57_1951 [Geobacteraceae bacterium]|nr:hypothetical protein [Geobacteraceae bacterium]